MKVIVALLFCSFASVAYSGDYINCNGDLPLKLFFSYPEPLVIHSGQNVNFQSDASISEDIPSEWLMEYKVQKQIFGVWITVFSAQDPGNCQTLKEWGFGGTCPMKKGEYRKTKLSFALPKFRFASYLVNGNYRIHVEGYTMDRSKLLFCGNQENAVVQNDSPPIGKPIAKAEL